MAVERVGIEIDLGVEAAQLTLLRDHQRIDFQHRHVGGDEGVVELRGQLLGLLGKIAFEAERLRDMAAVMRHHAGGGIDRESHDLLRRIMRHLLDVHASFGRNHIGDARCLAIDQHREIEFLCDVGAVFDVETIDLLACRAGLHRHQSLAEHVLREACNFIHRLREPHAALRIRRQFLELALAATTGVNLRLHHIDRTGQRLRCGNRFVDCEGRRSRRHRHTEIFQDSLALILVNVHGALPLEPGPECPVFPGLFGLMTLLYYVYQRLPGLRMQVKWFRDHRQKKKRRAHLTMSAPLKRWTMRRQAIAADFSTTDLRHGFSTTRARSDARMFAPAATRNTASQLPCDCCR